MTSSGLAGHSGVARQQERLQGHFTGLSVQGQLSMFLCTMSGLGITGACLKDSLASALLLLQGVNSVQEATVVYFPCTHNWLLALLMKNTSLFIYRVWHK